MKDLLRPRGRSIHLQAIGGLFVLVWLAAGVTHADTIGIYADQYGSSCNLGGGAGLRFAYVIHVTEGATAIEFMAPKPACWTGATWLRDEPWFVPDWCCDDSQTGEMIAYGACKAGTFPILTIVYSVQEPSAPCCPYPVLPYPGDPGLQVADCDYNFAPAAAMMGMVNGNATCPCGYPVPVEETTWGSVKALYAE